MNIGSLAHRTGVSAKAIRFYESVGLIPPAQRAANGYRRYDESDVRVLTFIQRARELGFSVDDVRDLLTLWRDKGRASAEVKKLALRHKTEIEKRIARLESLKRVLAELTARCHGDDRPDCPILDSLAGDGERPDCH